jgi:hypothetical protein
MEWYSINYLYPKSFKRFCDVMFPNVGIVSISTLKYYDIKKLYYFFDSEGVYLFVERLEKSMWNYNISLHNGICFGLGNSRKNREEIEVDGFYECFRILDRILTDEQSNIY